MCLLCVWRLVVLFPLFSFLPRLWTVGGGVFGGAGGRLGCLFVWGPLLLFCRVPLLLIFGLGSAVFVLSFIARLLPVLILVGVFRYVIWCVLHLFCAMHQRLALVWCPWVRVRFARARVVLAQLFFLLPLLRVRFCAFFFLVRLLLSLPAPRFFRLFLLFPVLFLFSLFMSLPRTVVR
ncbi:hypothetical protein SAMN04488032_103263 [Pacificibacter marinus]|nr:hypothetical protein SAMN04488032_103263 [Pacificibacter marinus]